MLVLTRRLGEELIIGDDISITILNINGRQVRVGIKAPEEINIRRAELPPRAPQHDPEQEHG